MSKAEELIQLCENVGPHEYACLMFDVPNSIKNKIKELQKQIDSEDVDPTEGLEEQVHITLLYGIEDTPEIRKKSERILTDSDPLVGHTGDIEIFEPENEDYDVVVVRVRGTAIHDLRKRVEKEIPNTQTFPEYRPHLTVGYVRKGTGKKYKDIEVSPVSFLIRGVIFSGIDGSTTTMTIGKVIEESNRSVFLDIFGDSHGN